MGAYCDGRILTPAQSAEIMGLVIEPALAQMIAEDTPYTGFLYAGLMMTPMDRRCSNSTCAWAIRRRRR